MSNNKLIIVMAVILVATILGVILSQMSISQDKDEITDAQVGLIKVSKNIYSFGSNGYYSFIMITDDGIIIVDPITNEHALKMSNALKEISDQPIKYVIYSHNHFDHIGGASIFTDATILSHADTWNWLEDNPNPHVREVDEVWNGGNKTISLGDDTIQLYQFGESHGKGMTVFYIPEQKIMYLVDILTPNRLPFTIMPDFSPKGWEHTLILVENFDVDTFMFSHKNATGTKDQVIEIREYLQDLKIEIITMMQAGVDPMQIPSTIELPKYEHFEYYDEWLEMNAWRVMLEMWMGW